ncbi:hypothetical protein BT96DRAFT_627015 [Gymnopus androsaceus JB14]|uniref:Uncharacterized protein n=1 Tax=Gymnopus androsaceus JB14 TaxID=1447944 RepID=A0A6A4IIT7_9AGAR|nr:hypothetical protein BT96DRAFT_627015 [Gymnopus androsaceus JB14]
MSSTCPPSQPCSAQLQTKYTLLSNSRTSNTSPVLISDESVGPKRTRTTSTSSVDTIRISPGKKKSSSSKKRARASEPSSNGECDQTFLQDIRRTRQRKLSTDTVRATVPSAVAFPALSDSHERASSPGSPRNETGGVRAKKKDAERKVTPPKLNPGHAAPSVAITPVSRADDSVLEVSSPTSNRHAPPPPIANAIRTRVLSMKNPPSPSLPTSPAHRTIMHSAYRTYGFDPLPAYLQDWQPPCTPYVLSDDEDSYDGAAPSSDSSWKDEWDNTHPGMSDLDLSISFHKKQPFFDVWDLPDECVFPVFFLVKPCTDFTVASTSQCQLDYI